MMEMTSPVDIEIVDLAPAFAGVAAALHEDGFDEAWNADAMVDLLAVPGAFGLLAFEPGEPGSISKSTDHGAGTQEPVDRPLGFVLVQAVLDEAEITTIVVANHARRRGVARRLLEKLRDRLTKSGVTRLLLEVAQDNPGAIALYNANGFREIGRRKGYYRRGGGTTIDALVMECRW
jgi:ribosomal-protein-alanine N-acetyltransferase